MQKLLFILFVFLSLFSCSDPKPLSQDQLTPGDQGTIGWTPIFQDPPERNICSETKRNEILNSENDFEVLNCNLTLERNENISIKLVFIGNGSSGVTLDCNDNDTSNIEIHSVVSNGELVPPHDITIQNCNVFGHIRLWGPGVNGGSERLLDSSRTEDHVTRTRDSAPYHITFDNVAIYPPDGTALYFAPGVHHCVVRNSVIITDSYNVQIYLDAETYGIELIDNYIESQSLILGRELIAVDGSSYNIIRGNTIANAPGGGIYFYRNCGFNRIIRHATPSNNIVENNEIDCDCEIRGIFTECAGIYLGSRNGGKDYCSDDAGYEFGSSISDQDHARFNEVRGNILSGCRIEVGNETNHSNVIE